MNKTEIIFAIILIISYIISSLILKIPLFIHLMFGLIILGVLIIAIILKLNHNYENEKISNIAKIISILLIIFYGSTKLYENFYNKPLLTKPSIIVFLIFIFIIISWIFRKNNN